MGSGRMSGAFHRLVSAAQAAKSSKEESQEDTRRGDVMYNVEEDVKLLLNDHFVKVRARITGIMARHSDNLVHRLERELRRGDKNARDRHSKIVGAR